MLRNPHAVADDRGKRADVDLSAATHLFFRYTRHTHEVVPRLGQRILRIAFDPRGVFAQKFVIETRPPRGAPHKTLFHDAFEKRETPADTDVHEFARDGRRTQRGHLHDV